MAGFKLSLDEALRQARGDRASPDVAKWSARKTLLFIGGASLGLWLVIILIATQLLG
jgi:hypothetical protein